MPTASYPNLAENTLSSPDFSTATQHPLQIVAEDRLAITDIFLRHLAHSNFTRRRFQIVLTVFNQTLGFNKFEDDMNGARLQQLTGVAANHANSTVRELEQLKVLVSGHHYPTCQGLR